MSARGAMITVLATELSEAVKADEHSEGHDIGAGLYGPAVSAWIRKTVDAFIEVSEFERYRNALYQANGRLTMLGEDPVKLELPVNQGPYP